MAAENIHVRAPSEEESNWPRARIGQWVATALVVAIAEVVFFAGFAGVSYLLDAVAVVTFFGLRKPANRSDDQAGEEILNAPSHRIRRRSPRLNAGGMVLEFSGRRRGRRWGSDRRPSRIGVRSRRRGTRRQQEDQRDAESHAVDSGMGCDHPLDRRVATVITAVVSPDSSLSCRSRDLVVEQMGVVEETENSHL